MTDFCLLLIVSKVIRHFGKPVRPIYLFYIVPKVVSMSIFYKTAKRSEAVTVLGGEEFASLARNNPMQINLILFKYNSIDGSFCVGMYVFPRRTDTHTDRE